MKEGRGSYSSKDTPARSVYLRRRLHGFRYLQELLVQRVTPEGLHAVAAVALHNGQIIVQDEKLREAHVQSSSYPLEVHDAHVALAPIDARTNSCGRRQHQAE